MKSLVKGFLIAAAMLSFAVAANAEEASTGYKKTSDDISFNYEENTFSIAIEEEIEKSSDTELTVMPVKGDYTKDANGNNISLATVTADDICYIGQQGGRTYSSLFKNLGVKYTEGKFTPGEYTLVKSGEGMTEASKTKIFLGNAVKENGEISDDIHIDLKAENVTFGTMSQTLKVYEDANTGQYIYIGVGNFPLKGNVTPDKLGFAVQKVDGDDVVDKGYRSLNTFANVSDSLENISSFDGVNIEVGIQIKGINNNTEIVAIPYVLAAAE